MLCARILPTVFFQAKRPARATAVTPVAAKRAMKLITAILASTTVALMLNAPAQALAHMVVNASILTRALGTMALCAPKRIPAHKALTYTNVTQTAFVRRLVLGAIDVNAKMVMRRWRMHLCARRCLYAKARASVMMMQGACEPLLASSHAAPMKVTPEVDSQVTVLPLICAASLKSAIAMQNVPHPHLETLLARVTMVIVAVD